MESTAGIKLNHVSKTFAKQSTGRIKSLLKLLLGKKEAALNSFFALKDISIEVKEGERVGIIGHNGAGKTTLLSIIAGLLNQDAGERQVNGKVNPVMNIGTGIREDLTGLENIYLTGELNGKSKQEINELVPEIIEFTDIGEFIHYPLRTYSSGMKARLAFSMISFIDPEILIIDEVLGVGDKDFAAKSFEKIMQLCNKGKILLAVSHSMDTIKRLTTRCILLEKGRIVRDGPTAMVVDEYLKQVELRKEKEREIFLEERKRAKNNENEFFEVIRWGLKIQGSQGYVFSAYIKDFAALAAEIRLKKNPGALILLFEIYSKDGTLLISDYKELRPKEKAFPQRYLIEAGTGQLQLSDDIYNVTMKIKAEGKTLFLDTISVKILRREEHYLSKPYYLCDYKIEA